MRAYVYVHASMQTNTYSLDRFKDGMGSRKFGGNVYMSVRFHFCFLREALTRVFCDLILM